MKKCRVGLIALFFLLAALSATATAKTPVAQNGKLSVKGTKIVNAKGKPFQIKGVSTHGLSWFPQYVSKEAFRDLRDKWGANTVRLAMYTAEGNGYCTGDAQNKKTLEALIDKGVKAATDLGMYVIIDWHVLQDRDPNVYQSEAISFFKKVAKKYKNHNNVLYEICNEPNSGPDWARIKTYAQKTVKAIRDIDKDAIIIVGTPTWSQDVDEAAKSPLKGSNLVYTLHFYADTHRDSLRQKAETAIRAGLPILVSEFSICSADGAGAINTEQANIWIRFLDKYQIGYASWSLCNKAETSALIRSDCAKTSGWNFSDLSDAGKWLVRTFGGSLAKQSPSKPSSNSKPGNSGNTNSGNTNSGNTNSGTASNGGSSASVSAVKATKKNTKATAKQSAAWEEGAKKVQQFSLTVKNKGKKTVKNWKVRITFKYKVQQQGGWNGKFTFKGKTVTIKPESYNATIGPKQSIEVGLAVKSAKTNKIQSVKIIK